MTDAPDLLAAELARIRELVAERGRLLALVMNLDAAGRDVGKLEAAERGLAAWAPRLLAAVEAALKLADECRDTEYPADEETAASDQWLAAAAIEARIRDGLAFREVIVRELLSKEGSDGPAQA